MTKTQAVAYAKKRWGADAVVEETKLTKRDRATMTEREQKIADLMRCQLGYRDTYMGGFHVMGFGPSWDDAVRRAER